MVNKIKKARWLVPLYKWIKDINPFKLDKKKEKNPEVIGSPHFETVDNSQIINVIFVVNNNQTIENKTVDT